MIMIPLKGGGTATTSAAHTSQLQHQNGSNNTSMNINLGSIANHQVANMDGSNTGVLSQQQQQQLLNLSASSGLNNQTNPHQTGGGGKKNSSKQRGNPGNNANSLLGGQGQGNGSLSSSTQNIQRQQEASNQAALKAAAAAAASLIHNQTTKIPQNFLINANGAGGTSQSQNSNYNSLQPPPASVMKGLMMVPISNSANEKQQKKRIGIKKVDESGVSDGKTIEQQVLMQSPNSSTLNLENMKKTQSLHYVARGAAAANGSGANSPQQQMKSRTSIGKYQNAASVLGMQAVYNNYNNTSLLQNNSNQSQQPRNSFLSKSQIGGAVLIQQALPINNQGSANAGGLSTGGRSRSKTATNRKKRNLYTSIGNYYQSQQQTNASSQPQGVMPSANSASRASKRLNQQQNYLENLEQTNFLLGGNIAAAHQMLLQEDLLTKKRNKTSTKSYNNKGELIDPHNTSSEVCYSSHIGKKNPLTNNFFEVSQFSGSNHASLVANKQSNIFGDSFQAGSFLPNQKPHASTVGLFSANKQRPTSSNKSTLMLAASSNMSSAKQPVQQQPSNKKKQGGALRKSVNNTLMNQSANYGHLQQNAYDFLANASLFMNTGKTAARRPKGSNGIDSRCSQTKDHGSSALNGLVKSQVQSNTAFGAPIANMNNTSHTTICSNRKTANQGEIVSGKKNSLQHQLHSNYMSLPQHTQDVLTAGEISSDRQTLKMNDFLKQIEAYSNDKLDKFMPQMNQAQHLKNIIGSSSSMGHNTGNGSVASNYGILNQQAKIAEQVKNIIDQEMQAAVIQNQQIRNSAKRRYPRDEPRDYQEDDENEDDEEDDSMPEDTPATSGGCINAPDYEHLLNVVSEGFNKLISTFYNNNASAIIGTSLGRVKESYEEIINSIVENLSSQIESLSLENEQLSQQNHMLKERNTHLEKMADTQERSSQQITSFAKQNEVLEKELRKLNEENRQLRKEQRERDGQLVESRKIIEKLSASQKQLGSQGSNLNHLNSQVSSKTAVRQGDSSMMLNQQSGKGMGSKQQVPPLDLGKLAQMPTQGQVQQQHHYPQIPALMSNDSLDTLNKGLINANLPDIDQPPSEMSSQFMNTVPHQEGSRMLEELYQQQNQAPFHANHSEISYENSDEEVDRHDAEAAYLSGGGHQRHAGMLSDTSSIAQDKSPLQKPFIPPLNLNGLNNRQQAAAQSQGPTQPPQNHQQQPQQNPQKQPKFKLDIGQAQQFSSLPPMMQQDQDSTDLIHPHNLKQQPPARPQGALGLNLANLKKDKAIVDYHDEFMAKMDEFSESWREAMRKEKRF